MRPIYARSITEEERETLRSELKSDKGVVVSRSHVILMSVDEGLKAQVIAERVGYSDETVRQVIQQAFKRSTPDKAVAWFGALCQETKETLMNFARGYPYSEQMWCEPSGELSLAELRRRIRAQFKDLTLDDLLQPFDPI